ncbi:MAG: hypothetical protein U0359_20280 [Byssovorax sp.]
MLRAIPGIAALWLVGCAASPGAGPFRYATRPMEPADIYKFRQFELERCLAACPEASAAEQVTDCYPASLEARRRIMSENIRDSHLVCVYAPKGAP